MQCELCGRECACRPALVDGVKMMVCPSCMQHGVGVKTTPERQASSVSPNLSRIKKPKPKDIYKNMDKELVNNWNQIIKSAREKKGISREELGFKIGERTVTIAKIENGDLRPSDKVVGKLEKELDIKLIEAVDSASPAGSSYSGRGLTLGDFIKKEE